MPLNLSGTSVGHALRRIPEGLSKYQRLQARLEQTNVTDDLEFQRAFNAFYRVRGNAAWRRVFYELLEREKRERSGFAAILTELHRRVGRYEASFASKLVATVDPALPVIDRFVLRNTDLRLPSWNNTSRLAGIINVHAALRDLYAKALESPDGRLAIAAFDACFPDAGLHDVKKLDLLLWQMR
jgi:hypothetical protein